MRHGLFFFFSTIWATSTFACKARSKHDDISDMVFVFLLALRFDVSFNRSLAATCSLLVCSLYASSLERSCDVSLIVMSPAERQELPRQGKTIYIVSFFSAPGSKTENGNNPFKLSDSLFILYDYTVLLFAKDYMHFASITSLFE